MLEALIASVVTSLANGALAKAKKISVAGISGAYDGLKKAVVEELGGKTGAVQTLEEDPESNTAITMLTEQLGNRELRQVPQLEALAQRLESAITEARAAGVPGIGDINFEDVRAKVNAKVSDLVASGSIKFGSVTAETGDATVSGLRAGVAADGSDGLGKKKAQKRG